MRDGLPRVTAITLKKPAAIHGTQGPKEVKNARIAERAERVNQGTQRAEAGTSPGPPAGLSGYSLAATPERP